MHLTKNFYYFFSIIYGIIYLIWRWGLLIRSFLFSEERFFVFVFWRFKAYLNKIWKLYHFISHFFGFLEFFSVGEGELEGRSFLHRRELLNFRFLEDQIAFNQNLKKKKKIFFFQLFFVLIIFYFEGGGFGGKAPLLTRRTFRFSFSAGSRKF